MNERIGPRTKYHMFYMGAWRPVTNMFDGNKMPTTLPVRATAAVLFIDFGEWAAITVSPGDILTRPGHVTEDWDTID